MKIIDNIGGKISLEFFIYRSVLWKESRNSGQILDSGSKYQKGRVYTFRHCFATHMLENGINIRVVQELMGYSDVKTTEIYTHVMEKTLKRLPAR